MPSDQLPSVSPTLLVRQEAGRRELEVYVGSSSSCKRVGATHTQLSHINGNLRKEGKVSPVKALSPRLGKASWHASKLHPDDTASLSLLDDTFPLPAFPHASISTLQNLASSLHPNVLGSAAIEHSALLILHATPSLISSSFLSSTVSTSVLPLSSRSPQLH